MIHPHTELRKVSELIGYGVFATSPIPAGTLVYVKDPLEIEINPVDYQILARPYQAVVDRYSYIDERGIRIVSWDMAKYVNHSCRSNSLSTGYGFEIAIRDIQTGEEITDDYGMLNMTEEMECGCSSSECRKRVSPSDWQNCWADWQKHVENALTKSMHVPQPLMAYVDPQIRMELMSYLRGEVPCRSVRTLEYTPAEMSSVIHTHQAVGLA